MTSLTQPSRGTVYWDADGNVTYSPEPGREGSYAMTYRVTDGETSATGTLTVYVRMCFRDVWQPPRTLCGSPDRANSADFTGVCTSEPGRWLQEEEACVIP